MLGHMRLFFCSVRVKMALKVAIGVLFTVFVALFLRCPHPYWSVITVFILTLQNVEASWKKAIMRLVGTILGGLVGLGVAALLADHWIILTVCLFLICAISMHCYLVSSHGYAWMLGCGTAFIVVLVGMTEPSQIVSIALWRTLEISLGIVISLGVGYLIFPMHAHKQLHDVLAGVIDGNKQLFEFLCYRYLKGIGSGDIVALRKNVEKKLAKSRELLALLKDQREKEWCHEFIVSLDHNFRLIDHLALTLHGIDRASMGDLLQKKAMALVASIVNDMRRLKDGFLSKDMSQLERSEEMLLDLHAIFDDERHRGNTKVLSTTDVLIFQAFIRELQFVMEAIQESASLLVWTEEDDVKRVNERNPWWQRVSEYFFLDADHIKFGVKVGISCVLTMWLWLYFGWLGGMVGIVSALVIMVEQNVYTSRRKARMRLLGCFIGGVVGILAVLVSNNIWMSYVILFLGVFIFAFIKEWYPRIAYLGLQGGIAFTLALIGSMGHSEQMTLVLERLSGIFMGVVVSMVVAHLLWPVRVDKELSKGLKLNFAYGKDLFEAILVGNFESIIDLKRVIEIRNEKNDSLVACLMDDKQIHLCHMQQRLLLHIIVLDKIKVASPEEFRGYVDISKTLSVIRDNLRSLAITQETSSSPQQLDQELAFLDSQLMASRQARKWKDHDSHAMAGIMLEINYFRQLLQILQEMSTI